MAEQVKKSNLMIVGVMLIVFSFLAGPLSGLVPRNLAWTALLIDGLRLCFFAGIALVLIGWVRNRKQQRPADQP
jgi:hypothetical protein